MNQLNKISIFISFGLLAACNKLSEGESTYTYTCANCHMDDGQGVANLVPPIRPYKFISERNQLICLMIAGSKDSSSQFGMPSYQKMSNAQIANVLNYINSKKKFNSAFFNETEIEMVRQKCIN